MRNNNLISISGKINSGKDTIGNIIQILTAMPHLTTEGVLSFLKRDINSPYKIKKFADKLKDIVCILLGCTREQLEDREFKEKELGEEWWYYKALHPSDKGKLVQYQGNLSKATSQHWTLIKLTPRLLLQLLGTECGRQILHPNIWVNSLFADYKDYRPVKTIESLKKFELGENKEYPKWCITDMRFPNEMKAVEQRNGITIRVERDLVERTGKVIQTSEHESETSLDNAKFSYTIENNGTLEELIEKVKEILITEKII